MSVHNFVVRGDTHQGELTKIKMRELSFLFKTHDHYLFYQNVKYHGDNSESMIARIVHLCQAT